MAGSWKIGSMRMLNSTMASNVQPPAQARQGAIFMSNIEDHIKQAHDTLEAARTSVEAARRAYERTGSEADAHFLRDAETAYDEALAAYDVAAQTRTHPEDRQAAS
jgi:hypothetical protein